MVQDCFHCFQHQVQNTFKYGNFSTFGHKTINYPESGLDIGKVIFGPFQHLGPLKNCLGDEITL